MKKDYNENAKAFLLKTGTTFTLVKAVPQHAPLWHEKGDKHGIEYAVTLKHGIEYAVTLKNSKHEYTFPFWDSIANSESNKIVIPKPKEYDVLSCLNPASDTFEDFCFNYGYDDDSRHAYKTYKAVVAQSEELKKLFTFEELQELSEIN